MTELRRIGQLLNHGYDGQPWYGTPLKKLLSDLTPERAVANPVAGAHSIWQEVLHVIAWRRFASRLLDGMPAAELSDDENWPEILVANAATWQQALDELARTQEQLENAVARLTDAQLQEKALGKPYSVYVLLHGVIQHDVYHAGQIAILRTASVNL